jgi:hypothetical protein
VTLPASSVRVLFLLLDDSSGPVMLLLTDEVEPIFHVRIVALHSQDGTTTAMLMDGDKAFEWVEGVVDDLGINLIADMVTSFLLPDLDGIGFDALNDWAAAAFKTVMGMGKLLIP